MIQLIVGGKGSGKTKKMIDMINDSAKTTPGNIVCIEKSMKLTYDIDHAARLIDVDEYKISGYDMLYGFIAGILEHARAMSAVTNPLVNSYKRQVSGFTFIRKVFCIPS